MKQTPTNQTEAKILEHHFVAPARRGQKLILLPIKCAIPAAD
jgi:hypothetical protein